MIFVKSIISHLMKKETRTMDKITVKDIDVRYKKINKGDFICLTDIAKYKNPEDPRFIVYS